MVKRDRIWQPLIIAVVLVGGMIIGSTLRKSETRIIVNERPSEHFSKLDRVGQILRFVDAKYVDSIDLEKLSMDAIEAIFDNLDPHSFFIPPREVPKINNRMKGTVNGIGVEYSMLDDTLSILNVLTNGPAHKAGIKAGDRILAVDSTAVSGVELDDAELRNQFFGPTGTEISLLVDRYNEKPQWIPVRRGEIHYPSIDNVIDIDSATLYVSIKGFTTGVYSEFMDSLLVHKADEKEMNLILDLRDNTGGYLDEAIKILSQLIPERNLLLVKTVGHRSDSRTFKTEGTRIFKFNQIAVLINENSASASEIVAGALQDYDLATIIGRRSYGKGLVQNQYPLSDGSAIRLTIARYYTPSGRLIQKPYDPDLTDEDYGEEILNRYKSGELVDASKIPIIDSLKYYTRNGRTIYGSEGIVPDVFIPLDSISTMVSKTDIRATIQACSFDYARRNGLTAMNELELDDEELEMAMFNCMGNKVKARQDTIRPYLKNIFWENLLFIQAGSKKAKKFSLQNDAFVKAAMQFDENEILVSNTEEKESREEEL